MPVLSGGLFKATRHRVIRPPPDQANIIRYILIHFARVKRDLVLEPIWDSPLVKQSGKNAFQDRIDAGGKAPTQDEWLRERIRRTGNELCELHLDIAS
jgi:isopenicillin N synthase-like dioxygenase